MLITCYKNENKNKNENNKYYYIENIYYLYPVTDNKHMCLSCVIGSYYVVLLIVI
jgi:hypothetical protein